MWPDWDAVAHEHGFLLVALNRAGYARSTRRQGRRVADVASPFAHGGWLAEHIPTARTHMVSGHGRVSIMVRDRDEIVHDLIARKAAAAA